MTTTSNTYDHLVIVESPAKSKTIKKYLGPSFEVLASYGHVRDTPTKKDSVDPNNNFKITYQPIERNKKHIAAIKSAAKQVSHIYLATDPDREGEAISWHVAELLKNAKLLKGKTLHRVSFNEITKTAVTDAIANPREISMELVNAQQARLGLDFLVGFNLSPLLWKKVRQGLSAGRVQSPALRMIVEREIEIENFKQQEYWSITADLHHKKHPFLAKLTHFQQNKVEQFSFTNESTAHDVKKTILQDAEGFLTIQTIEKKRKKRNPPPPFITSTLQQEAVKKLGFSAKKSMMVAQQLYEGIALGDEGSIGLISYMRTDSIHLSKEAIDQIRTYVSHELGDEYLPDTPRVFKSKAKNAQEAHEAIRPTFPSKTPLQIQKFLNTDQYKLYTLIWQRSVASQMIPAEFNTVSIDLITDNEAHTFRATGSVLHHPGYLKVYALTSEPNDDQANSLPALSEGEEIKLIDLIDKQHFTEPQPRYSEATLVKALEEHGIGRPSTYATIISTLQQREYVKMEAKRFHPSDIGKIVSKFLTTYFDKYVEYSFTQNLENELDNIASGKLEWIPVLQNFWDPFIEQVKHIEKTVKKSDITHEKIDEKCPECTHDLLIKLGKLGRFIGCSNYPECKFIKPLADSPEEPPEILEGRQCPKCDSTLHLKLSRYRKKFIGCSSYPTCDFIEPLEKPRDTEIKCPKCQKNNLFERKSKRGKFFYACSGFPKCRYLIWGSPLEESCPKCHWSILVEKETKKDGQQTLCPQKECDYIKEQKPT